MEKTISQTIYNDFQDISPVSEKTLKLFKGKSGKIIEMLNEKLLTESKFLPEKTLTQLAAFHSAFL